MPSNLVLAQAVDPNAGITERAHWFTIATGCLDLSTRKFYPLDLCKERPPLTEQPEVVLREYLKWSDPPAGRFYKVGIESIFAQSKLFQDVLLAGVVPVKEIVRRAGTGNASMNKMMRLQGLAARYKRGGIIHPGREVGGVWLPDYANYPWLQDFEDELADINWVDGEEQHTFDDAADAWAMCVELLAEWIRTTAAPPTVQHIPFSVS